MRPAYQPVRSIWCQATAKSVQCSPRIAGSPALHSRGRPKSHALINRALAAKDGPIPPLIAETGGVNAMIVDGTALPEQVTDDVIVSAFRSAGQRCSGAAIIVRAG